MEEVESTIEVEGELLVFDRGVKTNFREGLGRWHGHVNVQIFLGKIRCDC